MSGLLSKLTKSVLIEIAGPVPGSKKPLQAEICAQIALTLPALAATFKIETPLRLAHFLSQTSYETDRFSTLREYASGQAYEGRADLGNTRPGDGRRYPGRSLIQVTGRSNYRNLTNWLRSGPVPDAPDFEAMPALLEEFPWAIWSAVWYWTVKNLNVLADRDEVLVITKKINGGKIGLSERIDALSRAKTVIARLSAEDMTATRPILYRGVRDRRDEVAELQRALRKANAYHLSVDGVFGPATENAVVRFQMSNRLEADGIVGRNTWALLVDWMGA